jgi:hypothetical protein
VTLVLLDRTGAPLGALAPIEVEVPWWQEVGDVVAAVRARDGADVQVLRVLGGTGDFRPAAGGEVTYLAQVTGRPHVALSPYDVDLAPRPHRAPWAEPGGPAASVGWAVAALEALGTAGAVASQQRTWNLSAIWRLDVAGAPVAWLKQVPGFFAHEAAMLGLMAGAAPGLVPPLLAAGEQGRMLLAHVPGEDKYGAGAELCGRIAEEFHPLQLRFAGRAGELLATGMPDRRLHPHRFRAVAEPWFGAIDGLRELIDDLPRRFEAVAACGMPDTLVHGDLHPGNTRVDGDTVVIMDWGDSTYGHPAMDVLRLTGDLPPADAEALVATWALRWRLAVPGSDPARAVELMRPVAHLGGAAIYADFVANIEESEHVYHASDVPDGLRAAVEAAGG